MKKLLLALFASLFVTSAFAGEYNPEMAACSQDMAKYCSNVPPGEGRQMKCMYDVRDRIAPDCAAIITQKYERYLRLQQEKAGR